MRRGELVGLRRENIILLGSWLSALCPANSHGR
jgi:hypothetical protein